MNGEMKQSDTPPPTALITGATIGIGYELAKQFAARKYNLILVARNEILLKERVEEFSQQYGVSASYFSIDLGKQGAAHELYKKVTDAGLTVDVLVNNAGFALLGEFAETDLATELEMIEVNVVTLTVLTKLFLKDMLTRKTGKILNVASTAAFQSGPLMAVYYASKAYVLYFSEAVGFELRNSGITVTTLCPGPTRTYFQKRAHVDKHLVARFGTMDPDKVAEIGFRGLMRGRRIVIPGLMNKLGVLSSKFLPRRLILGVIYFLHNK